MSTANQIAANRQNATHSTGPQTEAGKEISSRNNFRHGLATSQLLITGEDPEAYEALRAGLIQVYQPATFLEAMLVDSMAEHSWLSLRAVRFQNSAFKESGEVDEKRLSLFMRYQTTNERALHACMNQLRKLRADLAKELIGFESQKQQEAFNAAKIRSLDAKTDATNIDREIRTTMEAPLPGTVRILLKRSSPQFSPLSAN